jgi:hypothetical protein
MSTSVPTPTQPAGAPDAAPDGELLDTFGTGLQTTRLVRRPGGAARWLRSPGPDVKAPFLPLSDGFVRAAERASADGLRFATPVRIAGREWAWDAPGRRSLAQLLVTDRPLPGEVYGEVHDTVARLGSRLRVLHGQPPVPELSGRLPTGLARLADWLDGGRVPRAGAGFRHRLRSQMGPQRWEKLRSFTHGLLPARQAPDGPGQDTRDQAAAAPAGPPCVLLHGWLTLGSVILADQPETHRGSVVLCGVEAAQGRPEVDLGSVLGELEELRLTALRTGRQRPELQDLAAALLTHYGDGWDPATVAVSAVARIVTHARDFASHVGWHADVHAYIPMITELVDSDGTTALPAR